MNYKYPPIYKYVLLFAIVYMFLKYQNIMNTESLVVNTSLIVLFACVLDYILIKDQPKFFGDETKNIDDADEEFEHFEDEISEKKKNSDTYDDIDVYDDNEQQQSPSINPYY